MKRKHLDLKTIRERHQKGELDAAKTDYLQFLKKQPHNIEALHSLGILYAQQENYAQAIEYLQAALKHQPNNPTLSLHLANILKFQGLYSQAAQLLEAAIKKDPHFIPALNNLGTIYYAQGKLDDAIDTYRLAIAKQPDYVDAYYNLGLAQTKQNDLAGAEKSYQTLLELAPEHFAAKFHLACVLMQQNQIDNAMACFLAIEAAHPEHFETQTNLATSYLKLGSLNEAKQHYLKALEINANDIQILFNLGVISTQQGFIDHAIQYYQRAIELNPNDFALHNNLGVAFLTKQHVNFALHHFQEALRIQPTNEAIQHTIQFLSQQQHLLTSPPEYVKSLFDAYADHYEPHLLKALEYKLPETFHTAFLPYAPSTPAVLDILDLGCGTGLCGAIFKPYAKTLTGVDLSPNMLEVAAQKAIYTNLVTDDLTHFLEDKSAQYDLALAGDVFVYMGELTLLFAELEKALRPGGFLLFNTEICETQDFKMNQSGRFGHNKKYIDTLAADHHFKLPSYQKVITRMQSNEPVYGHLFLLQKT